MHIGYTRTLNTNNRKRPQHGEVQLGNSRKRSKWQVFSLADWIWTWQFANGWTLCFLIIRWTALRIVISQSEMHDCDWSNAHHLPWVNIQIMPDAAGVMQICWSEVVICCRRPEDNIWQLRVSKFAWCSRYQAKCVLLYHHLKCGKLALSLWKVFYAPNHYQQTSQISYVISY